MTVAELIEFLERLPSEMKVVYEQYSEQLLLERDKLQIKNLCKPRPDGWVQDWRPDMESETYLVLPGN